jgi:Tol biopolymer transport system component
MGWTADEANLLVSGRLSALDPRGIWVIPLDASPPWLLFEADRIHAPLLSPDGTWLAFYLAFGADASQDGLWIVKTDGSQQHHLPNFGSYRWRSGDQLLVIPQAMEPDEPELLQVDASSGESRRLTPFEWGASIGANDWQPSPDGRWLAFVSADGAGLMLAPLP